MDDRFEWGLVGRAFGSRIVAIELLAIVAATIVLGLSELGFSQLGLSELGLSETVTMLVSELRTINSLSIVIVVSAINTVSALA